jgi:glucose/arabinose dehydrogenase
VKAPTSLADQSRNNTGLPLEIPPGFSVSILARNLSGARVVEFDSQENLLVSRPDAGVITLLSTQGDGTIKRTDILKNLQKPHGLAIDPDDSNILYFAEENRISKVRLNPIGIPQKIADLPSGAGHDKRTIIFGPDKKLYVAIGSSCNVCAERDGRRAKIFSINKDGSDFQEVATGLRNAPFLTVNPETGKIWTTEMGRDFLGDNLPPDEINILDPTAAPAPNYGWPFCYGKNVHDNDFDPRNATSCSDKTPSFIDIPAHSAPLGLAFVSEDSNWPVEYRGNLIVAYHGSWNRSVPTGYKIVRHKFDSAGNYLGAEDFLSGWLQGRSVSGRPVDIKFRNGIMYVSDDKSGVIYKIEYKS